jgi:integrase
MGRCRVKNHHLKQRGKWWHYKRRVPEDVAVEFGKEWVEAALKTTVVEDARRQRDKLNSGLERSWQRIRDAKLRKSPAVIGDGGSDLDEVANAYAAHVAERQGGQEKNGVALADIYRDQFDDLAEKFANGYDFEDLEEARDRAAVTPEGRRLGQLINAACGKIPISVAGEAFLTGAAIGTSTKRLYRRAYTVATEADLPSPEEVTKRQAREFIQGIAKDKAAATIGNYRAGLRQLWSYLGLDPGIWSGFRVDAGKKTKKRDIWTDDDVQKLLAQAVPKLRQAILIAAFTGSREIEIENMTYDPRDDLITFPVSKTVIGMRVIPCPEAIRGVVEQWVKKPWSRYTIRNQFSEMKINMGFPATKVFHSFRHTALTKLHRAKVQEATAARIVGHKHKELTFGSYGDKLEAEALREFVNLIEYKGVPMFDQKIREGD